MYGKLFDQMYDSSLCEVWQALVTFQQMIVLADSQGVLDMTPEALSRRTNIPLEIIQRGIDELEKPDERSRSPQHQGRRIERLDAHRNWGWQIINYAYYRNLASAEEKRESDRQRIARKRAAEKPGKSTVSRVVAVSSVLSQDVAEVAHREADGDREAKDIRAPAARDLLFETVAEVCGLDWKTLTKSERGRLNKACSDIRPLNPSPDDVRAHAAAYRKKYGHEVELTPTALAANWSQVMVKAPAAAGKSPAEVAKDLLAQEVREARREQRRYNLRPPLPGEDDDTFVARIRREAADAMVRDSAIRQYASGALS